MKLRCYNFARLEEQTYMHEETAAAFRAARKERSAAAVARGVRAERDRRYRRRKARARACVSVEIDGEMLSFLIRTKWLDESAASGKKAVGAAIAQLLKDAARR